jgi:hypothetical protein
VEREGSDLEPQPCEHQAEAELHQRMTLGHRGGHRFEQRRAHHAVHERHPVRDHCCGHGANEEELERGFRRGAIALEETRQHVERERHQLERDEEQNQLARRHQDQHAQQRKQQREMVLGGTAGERSG